MPYAEGTAYITHAEWESLIGADVVSAVTGDSTQSLLARQSASGEVDERAIGRGVDVPLASEYLTTTMKRRVAWIAAHHAASAKPKFRNSGGRAPYHDEHDRALTALDGWAAGLKVSPGDVADGQTDSQTFAISNTRRNWTRGR